MNLRKIVGSIVVAGGVAMLASGCFATRMVRSDTTTSYALVNAQPHGVPTQVAPVVAAPTVVVAPTPDPQGTLVVEALVVPPPPAAVVPVRLPDSVAAAGQPVPTAPPAPAWDPLPSYVAQFSGPGWLHRPMFGGGQVTSSSTFRRGWATGAAPYGYGTSASATSTGAYGSASPHFSSPPSYSGSLSSHFAGGYPGSGY